MVCIQNRIHIFSLYSCKGRFIKWQTEHTQLLSQGIANIESAKDRNINSKITNKISILIILFNLYLDVEVLTSICAYLVKVSFLSLYKL